MSDLKCEICKQPSIGVCSSPLGAISHAICGECITKGRQPWSTLVGGLYGCTKDNVADWIRPIIMATCKFYNKTEDQLWIEVERLDKQYEEYLRNNDPHMD